MAEEIEREVGRQDESERDDSGNMREREKRAG